MEPHPTSAERTTGDALRAGVVAAAIEDGEGTAEPKARQHVRVIALMSSIDAAGQAGRHVELGRIDLGPEPTARQVATSAMNMIQLWQSAAE